MQSPMEAFEEDLRNRPEGISPYTIRGYLSDLRGFAAWVEEVHQEPMQLRNITPVDVRDYKDYLQKEAGLKPATINHHLAALRAYLDWAVSKGLLPDNPVRVRNVEYPETSPRWLDERQFHRLLRAVQKDNNKRNTAIVQLLRHAGLRIGELCSLALSDLKLGERKGKVIVRSGKGRRYREVPLNKDVRRALRDYLAERPQVDDPQVFIGQRGNGIQERAVQNLVRKYARIADLGTVTPHMLRHTFGKGLLDKGVPMVTVQKLMGHKRLDSTARYTQPSERDMEVAVTRLELEEI